VLSLQTAEEIDYENGRISNFESFMTLAFFDLGSGHRAYHHASVIDLYLDIKFHSDQKNFFVNGWTGHTDRQTLRPALLG